MAEYRTVKMSFWTDPYIEDLSAEGKLLYLYLFTCPYANNLGVMEVSIKRISYETGIKDGVCRSLLADMERARKILRDGNLIWLTRFIKNQCSTSPKLVQSMKALFAEISSPKIRHAICLQYPHIFECSEDDMRKGDTLLPPDPYGTDTISIPSGEGEYGIKNIEKGIKNLEGEEINARAHAKEKKTPYGQFGNVLLTDKEHQSLQDEFGITGAQERIDNLDEYIASKGTRYKSHYATILSWNRRDSQKPQPVMRQARLSEAEERQRHNDEVCRQVSAELEAINSPF